jgi:hypothetical protein
MSDLAAFIDGGSLGNPGLFPPVCSNGSKMNTKNYSTADLRRRVSRILVPTDFSDQASKALEWARSFADAFGAKLVLLHVIDIFSLTETGSVMAGSDLLQEVGLKARSLIREFLRLTGSARPMLQARKG